MTWKIPAAAALATVMVAGTAYAQAPSGGAMRVMRKGGTATGDEMVKAAQQALKDKGHDPGTVDGRMGARTQAALRDFQKAQGMEPTGELDPKTTQALGMNGERTGSTGAAFTDGSASPATK